MVWTKGDDVDVEDNVSSCCEIKGCMLRATVHPVVSYFSALLLKIHTSVVHRGIDSGHESVKAGIACPE